MTNLKKRYPIRQRTEDGVNANAPIGKRRKKAMAARRETNIAPISEEEEMDLDELYSYEFEDIGNR